MKLRKLRARMIGERVIRASMKGHETAGRCRVLRMLSAANSNSSETARNAPPPDTKPGPFEASPAGNSPGLALITALLVIYPVFASAAIVVAGFWFLDGSGTV